MSKRNQRGDAGVTMLVLMAVFAVGWWIFGHGGMGHGNMGRDGDRRGGPPHASVTGKTALDLVDEAYARGEISREEWQRKRADLLKR